LWRAAQAGALPKKSVLNFCVNAMEPLLGSLGFLLIGGDFSLELRNPILRSDPPMRATDARQDSLVYLVFAECRLVL
jgi:hypothetical protein